MEDREKLVEFYMPNLTLKNMNFWDPNSRLGVMQLMALASWMPHDKTRVEEVKMVMKNEEKEPLLIGAELGSQRMSVEIIASYQMMSF